MKSSNKTILLILAILVGYLGIHRFYAGKTKSGILYLLTIGLFGIGWIVDIILIATGKFDSRPQMAKTNSSQTVNKSITPVREKRRVSVEFTPSNETISSGNTIQSKHTDDEKAFRTIHSKLKGVSKKNEDGENIQSILADLFDDCDLELVREPDNRYDSNAIKVYAVGDHIGYINAELAKDLAPKMDSGIPIEASIDEITGGDGYNYGCNITIRIPK